MQTNETHCNVRFRPGRPVVTPSAVAALEFAKVSDLALLARHMHGDWGDLNESERVQNELAVLFGRRIQSRYVLRTGLVLLVVTAADRSSTTFMLSDGS